MKLNLIKIVAFSSLLLLTEVFSEKVGHTYQKITPTHTDQSAWTTSHNFENGANYSQAIAIPFNYPFEVNLLPNSNLPTKYNTIPDSGLNYFSRPLNASLGKVILNPSMNTEILSYKTNMILDNIHYARDTNSRLPGIWHTSPMANTTSGIVFIYLKKNMGLNLDLSFRIAGNGAGHALFESLVSNVNFSYKLSNQILNMNPNYRLNMVLQLSNIQYYDERVTLKKLDFNKTTLRSQFISSGFTLNTKSVMFEGLIRLPIQQQAAFDLDGLLRPELQGRLGMKWYLPEYIKP